jgi:hypothetical protein
MDTSWGKTSFLCIIELETLSEIHRAGSDLLAAVVDPFYHSVRGKSQNTSLISVVFMWKFHSAIMTMTTNRQLHEEAPVCWWYRCQSGIQAILLHSAYFLGAFLAVANISQILGIIQNNASPFG